MASKLYNSVFDSDDLSDYSSSNFSDLPTWCWRQFLTMFYFTKSDIKTTVIPVTVFAAFAAPFESNLSLLHASIWTWLHLLQFDISNQIIGVEEDKLNKPDRPIASGRISLEDAWILRWALVPICVAYSAFYSIPVALTSLAIAVLSFCYNEVGVHKGHWVGRNSIVAVGFGLYELGASLVAGQNKDTIDKAGIIAVLTTIGILATTYHVQDFKDFEGDRAIGRKTFPIVMPGVARQQVLAAITLWSLAVSYLWGLDSILTTIVCGLGLYVGLRFMTMKNMIEDQHSFYWYNVWLTTVNCLPGIYRFGMQFQTA